MSIGSWPFRVPAVTLAVGLLCPVVASAQESDTSAHFYRITPQSPPAGQPFIAHISRGPCEAIDDNQALAPVTRSGNLVTVHLEGASISFCNVPVADLLVRIPGLPPGDYTIEVRFRDTINDRENLLVGARQVTVGPPVSESIPAIPTLGASAMALLIAATAIAGAVMRRR